MTNLPTFTPHPHPIRHDSDDTIVLEDFQLMSDCDNYTLNVDVMFSIKLLEAAQAEQYPDTPPFAAVYGYTIESYSAVVTDWNGEGGCEEVRGEEVETIINKYFGI